MAKPVYIFIAHPGPSPWKIVLLLEELEVDYKLLPLDTKQKPIHDLNPNWKTSILVDGRTDVLLCETGAITQYIVAQHNPERNLTFDDEDLENKYLLTQWLNLQMSAQRPNFGQSEVKTVLGLLDDHLSRAGQWLVGNKMTYADLAFLPWDRVTGEEVDLLKEYPRVHAWHGRMVSRPAFRKVCEMREKWIEEQKVKKQKVEEQKVEEQKVGQEDLLGGEDYKEVVGEIEGERERGEI